MLFSRAKLNRDFVVIPLLVLLLSSCTAQAPNGPAMGPGFPIPWDQARPSIYQYIKSHIEPGKPVLGTAANSLPDDEIIERRMGGLFVPGGADGGFIRHGNGGNDQKTARAVYSALSSVLSKRSADNMGRFYRLLVNGNVVDFIARLDAMLRDGQGRPRLSAEALRQLSRFLMANGPDREPVKLGIAMLALAWDPKDRELLFVLGRHEEFTRYCAEVLRFRSATPERDLRELAEYASGWGSIETVQRLAGTQDREIRDWVLRGGFRNSIMNEYLAYDAATTGDLLGALRQNDPDEIISWAGEIISLLVSGGPGDGMEAYRDGAEATELYIGIIRKRTLTTAEYLIVKGIERFLDSGNIDWSSQLRNGWTQERRGRIVAMVKEILARKDWRDKAMSGLTVRDSDAFEEARSLASAMGIDTWEFSFLRQMDRIDDQWVHLVRTDDRIRMARVVRLAQETLVLPELGSGPTVATGLEDSTKDEAVLQTVIMGVAHFPGLGWPIVKAALWNRGTFMRMSAISVMASWGRDSWSKDARKVLDVTLAEEPDNDLKEHLSALIEGRPIKID